MYFKYNLLAAFFYICWFLFEATASFAQPQQKTAGRNPDGTAFRISNDGQKVTDYLADLEMSVLELRQRIAGLEDELKQKDEQCHSETETDPSGRIAKGTSVSTVSEGITSPPSTPSPLTPPAVVTTLPASGGTPQICQKYIVPLNQRIDRLEKVLALTPKSDTLKTASACDAQHIEGPYKARIALLTEENMRLTNQLGVIRQSSHEDLQQTKSQTNNLQQQLDERNSLNLEIRTQLETANAKLLSALEEIDKQKKQLEAFHQEQLAQAKETSNHTLTSEKESARGKLMEAADKTSSLPSLTSEEIASWRSRIDKALLRTTELVMTRKSALDRQKISKPGISISPQPLVSNHGRSLDNLRLEARNLQASSNPENILKEIDFINQNLENDLRILNGLSKVP